MSIPIIVAIIAAMGTIVAAIITNFPSKSQEDLQSDKVTLSYTDLMNLVRFESQIPAPEQGAPEVKDILPKEDQDFIIAVVDGVNEIAGSLVTHIENSFELSEEGYTSETKSIVNTTFGTNLHIHSNFWILESGKFWDLKGASISLTYYFDVQKRKDPVTIRTEFGKLSSISGPFSLTSFRNTITNAGFTISEPEYAYPNSSRIILKYTYPETDVVFEGYGYTTLEVDSNFVIP